uniref:Uncharacterized protein n=1 Tax=Anguilla anguilla TaxID=7936 RepID=A0A0E9RSC4_ANGAN
MKVRCKTNVQLEKKKKNNKNSV